MKKMYIKPVCETEFNLDVVTVIAASVHGAGDAEDLGFGGVDDGTHDPGVKEETFWD